MSLRRGRPRFQRKGKKRKATIRNVLMPEAIITFRHGLHTYHHLEHFLARGIEKAAREAAEPLSITIGATINIEDLDEVPPEELAELEAEIAEILNNTGIRIVSEAQGLVPVDTGRLRQSISYVADEGALQVTVMANTGYAKFVEYGTSKMDAQPFLTDPAMEAEPDLDEQINDAIANHMDGNVEGDSSSDTVDLEIEGEAEAIVE